MFNFQHLKSPLLYFPIFSIGLLSKTTTINAQQNNANEQPLERVLVTGSRIKRSEFETANLIQVISAEDIQKGGFNSIYETLQATSPAMGANQSGRSATNVETINLRGFGPNRTLFLINGKRVANYPRVYNGNDNVFNLASIPITIVEKIGRASCRERVCMFV